MYQGGRRVPMYRWVNLGESSREESRLAYSNQRSMFYRREHLSLNKYLVYGPGFELLLFRLLVVSAFFVAQQALVEGRGCGVPPSGPQEDPR